MTARGAVWLPIAVLALLVVLADPRGDVPLIDDWTYAVSVERLLAGRGFAVSSWSSTFPAAQILLGALVTAPVGFSFDALRLSTLLAAAGGLAAFVRLLLALEVVPARAALAGVALAIYPPWFFLAVTFMTDVPFVAATLVSLALAASGLRDGRAGLLGGAMLAAIVAFLVRPVALALPAALVAGGLACRDPRLRRAALGLALGAGVVLVLAGVVVGRTWGSGADTSFAWRMERLRWIFQVSPAVYLEAALSMVAHLGLAALPVLVATAPSGARLPWRGAAALVLAAVAVSLVAPQSVQALRTQHTWSTEELGATRPLLAGYPTPAAGRVAAGVVATVLGLAAAAALVERARTALAPGGAFRRPAGAVVAGFGLASTALCFALWFFYDRYWLPLVPVVLALAALPRPHASGADRLPLRLAPAAALLALLAILDVTGTRDTFAFARVVAVTAARLHASGIAWSDLDAGYVENGWRLHAHPENLPPGARPERDVTHVTAEAREPWVLAVTPLPGYDVVDTIAVPTWWTAGDRLYVLADATAAPPLLPLR